VLAIAGWITCSSPRDSASCSERAASRDDLNASAGTRGRAPGSRDHPNAS
jgi:hypothetical protein